MISAAGIKDGRSYTDPGVRHFRPAELLHGVQRNEIVARLCRYEALICFKRGG